MDRLCETRERLVRELRVGNLGSHHPDEVAVTCPQRTLGLCRVLVAAGGDDRERDRFTKRQRDEARVPRWNVAQPIEHLRRRRRGTDRGVQVVGATLCLYHPRDGDGVGDRHPLVDPLVTAQPHSYRELAPDRVAHLAQDLQHEPGAPLERAAVTVRAQVRRGREEAAHDRGAGALQLDAVEASLGAVCRHSRVTGDDL